MVAADQGKFVFLFPGQGSQYVGMGAALAEAYPEARAVFDSADEVLDLNMSGLCFEGPEELLKQTVYTQPAILTHSAAVVRVLQSRGVTASAAAGHSVGEYAALFALDVLDLETALSLVKVRAELMYQAGVERPGTMAAIIGLGDEETESVCRQAAEGRVLCLANLNSPGQTVISGEPEAVERAEEIAKASGARRVVRLNVSGAFHSPLMSRVTGQLAEKLEAVEFRKPSGRLIPNVTAEPTEDRDSIKKSLIAQMDSPVRWAESMEAVVSLGYKTAVEAGPGKVLKGLFRRIDREVEVHTVGEPEEIESFCGSVGTQ
jgi:[acyl-carrier-protein] S-malonyltransferase